MNGLQRVHQHDKHRCKHVWSQPTATAPASIADCLAELEADMGLSYPPDTELAQRCYAAAPLVWTKIWLTIC